jgi:hypothetical protein
MWLALVAVGLGLLTLRVQSQTPTRRDKLAVVLYNFQGNTQTDKYGVTQPVTWLGDQVTAANTYFARVAQFLRDDSFGLRTMDVLPAYSVVLPRPAGSGGGCLWNPNTLAIGTALNRWMGGDATVVPPIPRVVPADVTVVWAAAPCAGDNIIGWYQHPATPNATIHVQNQGPKVSTTYGLWRLEFSMGFPWYGVLQCRDAAGMLVTLSSNCAVWRPYTGIGIDPMPTGTFYATPNQVRHALGWLTDANRLTVSGSGTHTFDLPPMETKVDGPMYAEIRIPAGSAIQTYSAEWRTKIGLDANLPFEGLMLRRGNDSLDMTPLSSKRDNPAMVVGQTLILAPSTATITLVSTEPGVKATVTVVIP